MTEACLWGESDVVGPWLCLPIPHAVVVALVAWYYYPPPPSVAVVVTVVMIVVHVVVVAHIVVVVVVLCVDAVPTTPNWTRTRARCVRRSVPKPS